MAEFIMHSHQSGLCVWLVAIANNNEREQQEGPLKSKAIISFFDGYAFIIPKPLMPWTKDRGYPKGTNWRSTSSLSAACLSDIPGDSGSQLLLSGVPPLSPGPYLIGSLIGISHFPIQVNSGWMCPLCVCPSYLVHSPGA